MTLAPLIVEDKVVVGVAGGEYGIRGYIAAYEATPAKRCGAFIRYRGPASPATKPGRAAATLGARRRLRVGDRLVRSRARTSRTGASAIPGPTWNPAQRPGDNLYSDSVVALDADTGKLKWHFQFTPNDDYDYDSVQVPVLVDLQTRGFSSGKLMLWGNRNGFFYVLDRATGEFIRGNPFVKVNWASGLDESGRPIETPQPPGAVTYPCVGGGTNWYSPSYSPITELFYVSAWENCGSIFGPVEAEYRPGQRFLGGRPGTPNPGAPGLPGAAGRGVINNWTEEAGSGAVLAIDPRTGEQRWRFELTDVTTSGILTTASNLLFAGSREGHFHALDARTGELLWKASLGGQMANGPMTYVVDGRQYVAVAAGNALSVFALGD